MTELKSLKNPTRLLTLFVFIAVFISAIGADGLAQIFPGASPAFLAGIVAVAGYIVTQYGTEKRIERAEALKDEEYSEEPIEDSLNTAETSLGDDDGGV